MRERQDAEWHRVTMNNARQQSGRTAVATWSGDDEYDSQGAQWPQYGAVTVMVTQQPSDGACEEAAQLSDGAVKRRHSRATVV